MVAIKEGPLLVSRVELIHQHLILGSFQDCGDYQVSPLMMWNPYEILLGLKQIASVEEFGEQFK